MAEVPRVRPRLVTSSFADASSARFAGQGAAMLARSIDQVNETLVQPLVEQAVRDRAGRAVTRDADGNLQVSLVSPLAGEMGVLHNRIATAAYANRAQNDAVAALRDIAAQNEGSPIAFESAARSYVAQLAANAPAEISGMVAANAEREAIRLGAGLVGRAQENARRGLIQSTEARIDMLSIDYTNAVASGDETAAAGILDEVRGQYTLLGAIPGKIVTPDAVDLEIKRLGEKGISVRNARVGAMVDDLEKTAEAGIQHSDTDSILAASVGTPHERRAQVAVEASVLQPEFARMSPAEQAAVLDSIEQSGGDQYSAEVVERLRKVRESTMEAVRKDPLGMAAERKIEELTPIAIGDTRSLQQRVSQAAGLANRGLNPEARLFTNEERSQMQGIFKGDDLGAKMEASMFLAQGLGPLAPSAAREIGISGVQAHAVAMLTMQSDPDVVADALLGESLGKEGAKAPAKEIVQRVEQEFFNDLAGALDPRSIQQVTEAVTKFAGALYAQRGLSAGDDTGMQEEILRSAYDAALGASGGTGGLQEVRGQVTVLPPGVSPMRVERALDRIQATFDTRPIGARAGEFATGQVQDDAAARSAIFKRIGGDGGVPSYASGEPVSARDFANMRIRPVGPGVYAFTNHQGLPLLDSISGNPYVFRMDALVAEGM